MCSVSSHLLWIVKGRYSEAYIAKPQPVIGLICTEKCITLGGVQIGEI